MLVEKSLKLNKENDHLEGTICVDLESVRLWDNHNPYLYHAYVELKAEDGSLAEVIPYDIGFRRIEIIDFLRRFFSEKLAVELRPQNEEVLRQQIRDQINDDILSSSRIRDVRFTAKDIVQQ